MAFLWSAAILLCCTSIAARSTEADDISGVLASPIINITTAWVMKQPSLQLLVHRRSDNLMGFPFHMQFTVTQNRPQTATILLCIILSGDIQTHPGPRQSSIHPCGVCERPASYESVIIACHQCDIWYHKSCLEVSSLDCDKLRDTGVSWICYKCDTPNYDNTLFRSYELDTQNQFSVLCDANDIFGSSSIISTADSSFEPPHHSSPKYSYPRGNTPSLSTLSSRS